MILAPIAAFMPHEKTDEDKKKRFFLWTGVLGVTGTIIIIFGAILLVYMPVVIRFVVNKERLLKEGTLSFPFWQEPPIKLYFKCTFFNITNYKDYRLHKAKPIVQEVGPYVYSQKWVKNKLVWHDNGTVTYVQNKTYFFEPELSNGLLENDTIYTINIPMLTAAEMFKNASPVLKVVLMTVFTATRQSFVMKVTIKELLWDGYYDPMMQSFRKILPHARYPYTRYALFYAKNGSDEGVFNVYTGEDRLSDINMIDTWKGMKELDTWEGPTCNTLGGTPGDTYHPNLQLNETIKLFIPDLCRTIKLDYTKSVENYGLKCFRFEAPSSIVANGSVNLENACYCNGKCLPSGAQNISECKYGAPIAFSFPHFLHADSRYLQQLDGLKPNKSLHEIYIDIEPQTGTPLAVKIRFQVNALLRKISGISQFEQINNTIFPIMWLEQTTETTEDLLLLTRLATISAYHYADLFSYLTMALGTLIMFAGFIYFFRKRHVMNNIWLNGPSKCNSSALHRPC